MLKLGICGKYVDTGGFFTTRIGLSIGIIAATSMAYSRSLNIRKKLLPKVAEEI